jgi:hypothetical protein
MWHQDRHNLPRWPETEFAVGNGRIEKFVRDSCRMQPAEVADAIVFA